jgi:hypothetical protein
MERRSKLWLTCPQGLQHEQIRPDRDDHISIIWSAISPGNAQWFEKNEDDGAGDFSTAYDMHSIMHSIMHYRKDAFGSNGAVVMESKDPNQAVPDNSPEWPTEGDKKAICSIYRCECPQARDRPGNCKPLGE